MNDTPAPSPSSDFMHSAIPSPNDSSSLTQKVRRNQRFLLLILALGVIAGATLFMSLNTQDKTTNKKAAVRSGILAPGGALDPRDAWRGQADAQLKSIETDARDSAQKNTALEKQNQAMLSRLKKLEEEGLGPLPPPPRDVAPLKMPALVDRPGILTPSQTNLNRSTANAGSVTNGNAPLRADNQSAISIRSSPLTAPTPIDQNAAPSIGFDATKSAPLNPANPANPANLSNPLNPLNPPPGERAILSIQLTPIHWSPETDRSAITPTSDTPQAPKSLPSASASGSTFSGKTPPQNLPARATPNHDTRHYLPSGSFTRALLLGGLDAPTGGQSQRNPQPVLLRLTDKAMLPNAFRSEIRDCFVVGAGYGDISSERAYIRTESLSCISRQGQAIDIPIKGYIAGEDGKAGMRGRLVSKQGQVLANALLAGVASGIGHSFQQSATTVSVSPLGSTSTIDTGKQLEAGLGTGVGKSLDRLSQYYITLAEKIFPVIEIDAGRSVDIVLTSGVNLPHPLDQSVAPSVAPSVTFKGSTFKRRDQQQDAEGRGAEAESPLKRSRVVRPPVTTQASLAPAEDSGSDRSSGSAPPSASLNPFILPPSTQARNPPFFNPIQDPLQPKDTVDHDTLSP